MLILPAVENGSLIAYGSSGQ